MFIKLMTKLPPLERRHWLTQICEKHIEQQTVSLLAVCLLYSVAILNNIVLYKYNMIITSFFKTNTTPLPSFFQTRCRKQQPYNFTHKLQAMHTLHSLITVLTLLPNSFKQHGDFITPLACFLSPLVCASSQLYCRRIAGWATTST